jgi:Domain of unknown function (DUF4915)
MICFGVRRNDQFNSGPCPDREGSVLPNEVIASSESAPESGFAGVILVSFCNVKRRGAPRLALFNPSSNRLMHVSLPGTLQHIRGITGLTADERYIYAATQGAEFDGKKGAFLLIFARKSFAFVSSFRFRHAVDVHSMCLRRGRLLVVSTGTDEVIELKINGGTVESELVYWRARPGEKRSDNHHLNGICSTPGGVLLCGFGVRSDDLWSSATNGFIFNLDEKKMLASGLEHPHSVVRFRSSIVFCESRKRTVRLWRAAIDQILPGYTRGLCHAGFFLFAATSTGRSQSGSKGPAIEDRSVLGAQHGGCTINQLDPRTLAVLKSFNLNTKAKEIYDLLAIDDITGWPNDLQNC